MAKLVFSSRRAELSNEQLFALIRYTGKPLAPVPLPDDTYWQATEDGNADLTANIAHWRKLMEAVGNGGVIAGDFPHAALEALRHIGESNGYPKVSVYVRIYEIGGGFIRDTKFLRWAMISPARMLV